MDRSGKEKPVASLHKTQKSASLVVVTQRSGLTDSEVSDLRRRMRAAGSAFKVATKRLTRHALEGTSSRHPATAEPVRIAAILGGKRVLGRHVRSLSDLEIVVAAGLPKSALNHVAEHLARGEAGRQRVVHNVVPAATFKRRKDRLSREESERTERLARVAAVAEEVLGDFDAAALFLGERHPLLENRRPLDVALSEVGVRRVEEILLAIRHGLPV